MGKFKKVLDQKGLLDLLWKGSERIRQEPNKKNTQFFVVKFAIEIHAHDMMLSGEQILRRSFLDVPALKNQGNESEKTSIASNILRIVKTNAVEALLI